jgi:hypothetical protein
MALPYCRHCDNVVAADATSCPRCGGPVEPPTERWADDARPPYPGGAFAPSGAAAAIPDDVLYPVAIFKLVAMCVCTFGFYELFWFYRNWRRVRERTGRRLSPFWRMFFAPLWSFSLFEEVMQAADAAGVSYVWNSVVLGIAFFVLGALWRAPDPWGMLSLFSFVPLVPVQVTINAIAARQGVRVDDDLSPWQVALVLLFSGLVVLAVIGALLSPA